VWHHRQFTADEAAQLCSMSRGHLDIIIHRNRDVSTLFSEKRGSRRWFSLCDIGVLRIAFILERGGRSWLSAIGAAFDHLSERPPDPDDLLIVPVRTGRGCGLPFLSKTVPEIERPVVVVPVGSIVHVIMEAADAMAVQ
jgi:hypothetical protein